MKASSKCCTLPRETERMSAILARSSRNQKRSAIAIDFARRWRVARVETPATQPCKYMYACLHTRCMHTRMH